MFTVECRPDNEALFINFIGSVPTIDWNTTPTYHRGHIAT
jgi:hypothetical protein